MKKRRTSRLLAMVLLVAMMLSLMPTFALAEDATTETWTKVDLADVTEDDVVAISMLKDGTYYFLRNASSPKTATARPAPCICSSTGASPASSPRRRSTKDRRPE